MQPRSGSAITHRGSEAKGLALTAGLMPHLLRKQRRRLLQHLRWQSLTANRIGGEQNFPYKSSHNVLRTALVGLRSWGSIKEVVFVIKMAVIIPVENLKMDIRRPCGGLFYPGRLYCMCRVPRQPRRPSASCICHGLWEVSTANSPRARARSWAACACPYLGSRAL
jgi:hypothetical protein